MPLCPYCRNVQGLFSTLPTLLNCVGGVFILIGWPCSRSNRGLGSNESTCDTPPSMYKKITLFAFAGKCVGRGANGLPAASISESPAKARSFSSAASATAPKPLAERINIWRRVTGVEAKRRQCMRKTPGESVGWALPTKIIPLAFRQRRERCEPECLLQPHRRRRWRTMPTLHSACPASVVHSFPGARNGFRRILAPSALRKATPPIDGRTDLLADAVGNRRKIELLGFPVMALARPGHLVFSALHPAAETGIRPQMRTRHVAVFHGIGWALPTMIFQPALRRKRTPRVERRVRSSIADGDGGQCPPYWSSETI